jgi:hypothetical protein
VTGWADLRPTGPVDGAGRDPASVADAGALLGQNRAGMVRVRTPPTVMWCSLERLTALPSWPNG